MQPTLLQHTGLKIVLDPFKQSYIDDSEHGAGRTLLNKMKAMEAENLAIYVARYYGGQQIGKRRFEVYADLAKQAVMQVRSRLEKLDQSSENAAIQIPSCCSYQWLQWLMRNVNASAEIEQTFEKEVAGTEEKLCKMNLEGDACLR